jgi:hypothetical protein
VIVRFLVRLSWFLWGVLVCAALIGMVAMMGERGRSPEVSPGFGVYVAMFMLVLLLVLALLLKVATRRQSAVGLIAMTLVLVWPLVVLVGRPLVLAYDNWVLEREEARTGDFADPTLRAMARAISGNDIPTLTRLLKGRTPPSGKDAAGNDLLAYALILVRDKHGNAAPVRAVLEAGADPRSTRMATGADVLNYMLLGSSPAADETVRLLLDHGADPNAVDALTGETPIGTANGEIAIVRALVEHGADFDRIQPEGVPVIVDLIAQRNWESALYLIEKGARLDVENGNGLSVDYYLKEWKESVYGEHPEGWDKVRAAIAARRASPAASR